jgi:hypothetical protein
MAAVFRAGLLSRYAKVSARCPQGDRSPDDFDLLVERYETERNGVSQKWYDSPIIEGGIYVTFAYDDDLDRLRALLH